MPEDFLELLDEVLREWRVFGLQGSQPQPATRLLDVYHPVRYAFPVDAPGGLREYDEPDAAYDEQRYPFVLPGIGTDDEPPFVPFADAPEAAELDGEFRENMVVSVEFYAGGAGAAAGRTA